MPDALKSAIQLATTNPTLETVQALEVCDDYIHLMAEYAEYTEKTLSGDHGSTAKFWMIYIQLVNIFLRFSRACRTNDLDLFIFTLHEMCPIFFAGNRPNYSRWMVKYLLNLLNIEETHPGLRAILQKGAFSIRRTQKSFSRTAVDITLEQTVNADAASRSTGIAAFGLSDSARRRWMMTKSVRSAVLGHLLTSCGMKSNEDVSKSLKPYRVKRDNEDLHKLVDGIQNTMNPFSQEKDDNLYCLTTGVKVATEIRDDLLGCMDKGKSWHDDFLAGCFQDASRFEKPIPRRKVKNFASAALKSKVSMKDLKVVELQGTRDLFGRLLFLSTVEKVDLEKVFKYPLTPVPLSLAHIDGSLNKTDKAKLLHKLEGMVKSDVPDQIDVTVVDAMFFLHTIQNPPESYGKMASHVLQRLCDMSERTDFVCDTYKDPSLKEPERNRRGAAELTFSITGPDQKRPRDWQQALKSASFKTALFRFFAVEWSNNSYAGFLVGHQVLIGLDNTCFSFTVVDGHVHREEVSSLACQHEEADTRMVYHLHQIIDEHPDAQVSVRSNDTDVLVILAYHVHHMSSNPNVWMDVGLNGNNTRRYINISQMVSEISSSLIDALPGLHAFTGCDVTAAFMNKGKSKPLEIMRKNDSYMETFSRLGENINVSNSLIAAVEKCVCALYGKRHMSNVDDVRYAFFQQHYAPKTKDDPLQKIKGVNPSSMPPCRAVLVNKILRTNYVTSVWKNASLPNPCVVKPEGHGWVLIDGRYHIKWFDGEQVPQSICQVLGRDNAAAQYIDEDEDEEIAHGEELYGSDESDDEWE